MNRKPKSQTTSEVSRRRFLGVAALAPVALAASSVRAQDPIPPPNPCPTQALMGTVGVASGQMFRVSVFNHTEDPQQFEIEVFGLDGTLLGGFQGGCLPHTGTFADFDVAAGLKGGERVQAHVNVTSFSQQPLGATAEVFDASTGATRIPTNPCITPVPDPQMSHGSLGMIRGQAARVSVFHHSEENIPPTPCNFRIQIVGLDGKVLATHEGEVLPGQGAAFDWGDGSQSFPDLAKAERVQVHVSVYAEHPDELGATIEIYDPKTGETQIPDAPCLLPLEQPPGN